MPCVRSLSFSDMRQLTHHPVIAWKRTLGKDEDEDPATSNPGTKNHEYKLIFKEFGDPLSGVWSINDEIFNLIKKGGRGFMVGVRGDLWDTLTSRPQPEHHDSQTVEEDAFELVAGDPEMALPPTTASTPPRKAVTAPSEVPVPPNGRGQPSPKNTEYIPRELP